jgi:hypothetical protein
MADSQDLNRDLRRAGNNVRAFERQTKQSASRLQKIRLGPQMKGALGRGSSLVKTAAGMAGVWGFQQLLEQTRNFEDGLARLMLRGNKTAKWLGGAREQFLKVSASTGLAKDEVLRYADAYTEATGDIDGAMKAVARMGKVAVATGASMASLAGMSSQLRDSLGIKDTKNLERVFDILSQQEKLGKIGLSGFSQVAGKVLTSGISFGGMGKGVAGAQALGGLFQVAGRGFGKGQEGEVANAISRFMQKVALQRETPKGKRLLAKMGINLEGAQSLTEVFRRIGVGVHTSPKAFALHGQTLFDEGRRVAEQLGLAAGRGWKGDVGGIFGATGRKGGKGAIDIDYEEYIKTPAAQWKKATADMSAAVHRHMLPVLKMAVKLMPEFAKALKWVLNNSESLIKMWLGWQGLKFFMSIGRGLRSIQQGVAGGALPTTGGGGAIPTRAGTGGAPRAGQQLGLPTTGGAWTQRGARKSDTPGWGAKKGVTPRGKFRLPGSGGGALNAAAGGMDIIGSLMAGLAIGKEGAKMLLDRQEAAGVYQEDVDPYILMMTKMGLIDSNRKADESMARLKFKRQSRNIRIRGKNWQKTDAATTLRTAVQGEVATAALLAADDTTDNAVKRKQIERLSRYQTGYAQIIAQQVGQAGPGTTAILAEQQFGTEFNALQQAMAELAGTIETLAKTGLKVVDTGGPGRRSSANATPSALPSPFLGLLGGQ